MTNKELVKLFQHIEEDNNFNIFDIYESLSYYIEEYNEMEISNIKHTIYDAYELYHAHKDNTTKLIDAILNGDYTKVVEAFDLSKMIEKIPPQYLGFFQQLLEGLDLEDYLDKEDK